MSFYYLAYCMRQQSSKKAQSKLSVPPQAPPSSDKDKEDYKDEFEPNPDYGKDFFR